MAITVTAGIRNAEKLADLLKTMPVDLANRALEKAAKAGGEVFKDEMRRRAPVKRGVLRRSIRNRKARARVLEAARAVGPSAPHAHLVERGHVLVWVHPKTGKRYVQGHVPGNPFMRRSADAAAEPALRAIADTLSDAVGQIAAAHGARAA